MNNQSAVRYYSLKQLEKPCQEEIKLVRALLEEHNAMMRAKFSAPQKSDRR